MRRTGRTPSCAALVTGCLLAGARGFAAEPAASLDGLSARHAVARGLAFLGEAQRPNGEFASYRWIPSEGDPALEEFGSPFTTATILVALQGVEAPQAAQIRRRGVEFLRGVRDGQGLWRFFLRHDGQLDLVPPDTDDTAVAAAALRREGVAVRGVADALARCVDRRGRLMAWLFGSGDCTPSPSERAFYAASPLRYDLRYPNEYDCVTHANGLAFLALEGRVPKRACELLEREVATKDPLTCQRYYRSLQVLGYAAARAYRSGATCLASAMEGLRTRLLARQGPDGSWGNSLETALAAAAVQELGCADPALQRAHRYLLSQQLPSGAWPNAVFYQDNVSTHFVYGAESITTALAVEALAPCAGT